MTTKIVLDQFTLDIVKDSLYAIGEEMFISIAKTSKSPVIYETLDFASGLTDEKGNLLTQGDGVTLFIGLLSTMVKDVIDKYANKDDIAEGDIFITNDPFGGGGSHLSDVGVVMPIFYDGEIVAYSANKAHWTEVGGKDPGSWTVDSTEIYQEGLQFPCIKLFEKGRINEPLVELIKANVRFPDLSIGDMWAQVAGLKTGEKRVRELCDKYGKNIVVESIQRMLKISEDISRKEVQKIPNGVYEAKDFIDDDGISEEPLDIKVKVTIDNDRFICDFTGSHKQALGPINVAYAGILSAVRTIFLAATNPSQDVNDGVFAPLELIVEEGSVFNAKRPAAVSTYWETMVAAEDLVWKALAPVLPERLSAGHLQSVCGYVIAGNHPDTSEPYISVGPLPGGWGAGKGKDGEIGQFCIGDGETYNIPAEVVETRYGLMVEECKLTTNGAGAGEYRGGSGVITTYRQLNDGGYFTGTFGRFKFLPWGINGGKEGSRNMFEILKKDGTKSGPYGKYARHEVNEGDAIRTTTATGGGYGNPLRRPKEKVIMDMKDGFITKDQAYSDYGLEIDPETFELMGYSEERKKLGSIT